MFILMFQFIHFKWVIDQIAHFNASKDYILSILLSIFVL